MDAANKSTWYLHVYQGQGGVIELPVMKQCSDGQARSIGAVGSAGCRTCVCIYVHLEKKHYFAAHMSASVNGKGDNAKETWCLSVEQGNQLEEHIRKTLNADEKLVSLVLLETYQMSKKKQQPAVRTKVGKGIQTAHGFGSDHAEGRPVTYFQYKWWGCGPPSPGDAGGQTPGETAKVVHGSPVELWPDVYGWESVKRVESTAGTEVNRTMSGEWCFVWCNGRGWISAAGETPADLDCLS
ncbi:hypothetical protein DOTSEDRAFT_28394 [Dothistroma septosporum NZE10]|uniref:Uncharacterized protein n=1 Tax=Dothistroma septosporum (strain NZE10 / CBS 128990) TaxID=675120 RepID=M2Y1P0_DOTSN|nr:hypothetical protein DOTSEDRAFT_28394 [Dothistroma septosporum NZE10]